MNRNAFITGLTIAGLLSIVDIALAFTGNGEYPPRAVAVTGAALGAITIAGIVLALRGSGIGVWITVLARCLSALGAVPAFVVGDVPPAAVAAAAVVVVLTVVALVLLAPALRARPQLRRH